MSLPINSVTATSTQALLVTCSPRYEEMMFELSIATSLAEQYYQACTCLDLQPTNDYTCSPPVIHQIGPAHASGFAQASVNHTELPWSPISVINLLHQTQLDAAIYPSQLLPALTCRSHVLPHTPGPPPVHLLQHDRPSTAARRAAMVRRIPRGPIETSVHQPLRGARTAPNRQRRREVLAC